MGFEASPTKIVIQLDVTRAKKSDQESTRADGARLPSAKGVRFAG